MEIIDGGGNQMTGPASAAHEMPRWRIIVSRIICEIWYWRLSKWLPRLVWLNDEVDVTITFTEDKLNPDNPMRSLFSGGLYEVQARLEHMGISFDTGTGFGGRDWEWDWSLSGPVNVRFRGRAKRPERRCRQEKPMPRLVASN